MSAGPDRRRALRVALVAAGALALVLAALLAAAPALVDREALRERIQAEASLALGLPVRVGAVADLRLLPRPRIVLGPVRVLAAGSDTAAPLAAAERMRLELALAPLLSGRAEPVLLQADGIALQSMTPTRRRMSPPRMPPSMPHWLAALSLPSAEVRDAELTLRYPAGARRLSWPVFGEPGRPPRSAGTGPITVLALLPLITDDGRLAGTLTFGAQAETDDLPALTLAPLRLAGADLRLGSLLGVTPVLSAERAVRNAPGVWRVSGLALSEGELDLRGELVLEPATGAAPRSAVGAARARFRLAPLDLRRWLARHLDDPIPGAADRLRCVAAAVDVELVAGRLDVAPLALRLDDSQARAAASLRLGQAPRAAAALRLDRLDLDPYLRAPAQSAPDAAASSLAGADCAAIAEAAAPGPAQPDLPALPQGPDAADLVLDLGAESLRAGALAYGDLGVNALQQGRHTVLDIAAGAFYGGTLKARIERMQRPAAPPRQTLRGEATGADLGALLTDLQGEPQMTGTAYLTAELAAAGSDTEALRRDLSGSLRLRVANGRLAALDRAAASFGPLLSTVGIEVTPDTLAISRLGLSADGEDGVFRSQDIDGRVRLFALAGTGALDLPAERVQADVTATLVQPPDGPDLKGLAGIQVPIRITGPVTAPEVDAELGPAVAEAARRAARRHLDGDGNVLEQLEDATGVQGLEEGLRNLFGL
ncbi:AsmA family protein [Thiohalocapsa halophila]|uniref:AsmA family protein n=1 Tax=Thiohalocapsa halophila TaxID=69359 RepID=UPI0019080DFB|nr:AsmA-like C-terminal region-containing protein [Thiohalocapsa halophila]